MRSIGDLLRLTALSAAVAPSAAVAQSCTASYTTVDFGSVDVTLGAALSTTGALSLNCTGIGTRTVRVCVNLGGGSGGSAGNLIPRYMASGGNLMSYNLYTDPGYTTIWGSPCCGYAPTTINVPLTGGGGSTVVTLYGRIDPGQTSLPVGAYSSSFNNNSHARTWWFYATLGSCNSISTGSGSTLAGPVVNASFAKTCRVAATNLNFGTSGVLATATDAASTVSVTCSNPTPYTVGLSIGTGAGATTANRKMTGPSGATVNYSLYLDAARSQLWGASVGVDTIGSSGTGSAQSFTVYGRVPAQTTPAPGTYSDVINVTVTY
jgi:spore coat protein U-like protein